MAADLEYASTTRSTRSEYIQSETTKTIDRYTRAVKAIVDLKTTEILAREYNSSGFEGTTINLQTTTSQTGIFTIISITYRGAKLSLEDAEAIVAGRIALANAKDSESVESIA